MQLEPVIMLAVVVLGLTKIFRGPLGSALAERIRGNAPPGNAELAAEVDHLRHQLAEVEERLDFAERLLAQAREADQLPGGTHR